MITCKAIYFAKGNMKNLSYLYYGLMGNWDGPGQFGDYLNSLSLIILYDIRSVSFLIKLLADFKSICLIVSRFALNLVAIPTKECIKCLGIFILHATTI